MTLVVLCLVMAHIFAWNCLNTAFGYNNSFSDCFRHVSVLSPIRFFLSKQKLCSLKVFFDSFLQNLQDPVSYTTVRQQKQNSKTETEILEEERGIKNFFRCRYGQMQENCISQICIFHSLRAVLHCDLIENAYI